MKGRKLDQSGAPNQTQIIVNKTKIRNWSLHSARTHQAWWKSGSFSTAHATVGPSKPNPFQITQDVFSHRPFQLTHYSPALCNQIKRKINYSMDHFGARREDAQYNTGRTAVCMHGMVWAGRRLFPSSVALVRRCFHISSLIFLHLRNKPSLLPLPPPPPPPTYPRPTPIHCAAIHPRDLSDDLSIGSIFGLGLTCWSGTNAFVCILRSVSSSFLRAFTPSSLPVVSLTVGKNSRQRFNLIGQHVRQLTSGPQAEAGVWKACSGPSPFWHFRAPTRDQLPPRPFHFIWRSVPRHTVRGRCIPRAPHLSKKTIHSPRPQFSHALQVDASNPTTRYASP